MYRIGIDFGGTNIAVGIVNEKLEVLYKSSLPTLKDQRSVDEMVSDMATLCLKMVDKMGITLDMVAGIGIASPGVVNSKTGVVEYYCGMNLENYPMAAILSEKLGGFSPIYMENDANAAALGEVLAGAAAGARNALMITLGTGVGGGIIIDGKIYDGFNFAAAELGHTVIEKDGVLCNCGRRGCWEKYSSATGLIRMTKEEMEKCPDSKMWEIAPTLDAVDGKTSYDAAKSGDEAAKRVVAKYQDYLAVGLANMVNVFQPEILCIGGGVCGQGDTLLLPVNEQVMKEQYARTSKNKTKLVIAALGNNAGIVGAAALGYDFKKSEEEPA
jgi:glucokinase